MAYSIMTEKTEVKQIMTNQSSAVQYDTLGSWARPPNPIVVKDRTVVTPLAKEIQF